MIERIRKSVLADTGGVAVFALVILSLLYFFDEFDTAAFGVLAPDIEKAFHLSDARYGFLVVLNVSVLLLLAIPVGYYADRMKRTRLVVASGMIAGLFSFGTGIAGSIGLLTLMRFGNGVGLLGNIPIHNSLLADYYPVDSRPRVFAFHSNAMHLGAIIGPVFAGVLGSLFSWRAPFVVMTIPILITTWYVRRLEEPVRGATDDPSAAIVEADDRVRFREGVRILWSVRTLRRQFIGSLFFGAGTVPLAFLLPLYLERVYGIAPFGRGVVGAIDAAATLYGVRRSGKWAQAWFAKSMGEPLRRSAYCLIAVGIGLALLAAAPWFWLAVVIGLVNSFIIGCFTPPFTAVQALVSPARARTMSFSFGALFLVVGVIFLFYGIGMGSVSDNHGMRWGIAILMPYWVIAGLILTTAAKFVADDAAAGLRSLSAAAAARGGISDAEGNAALLVARGVDVAYDQTQVLFGVDLDVYEGEIVALLGTNGAGKSTLLKAISGLNSPINGAIYFDGKDIARLDTGAIAHLGVAQVPGGRGIFPSLTVEDNIRAAGWLYRGDREYLADATKRVLEYFPILQERWQTSAGSLSGGEQQMLSLAQAFIAKPRLLMIDELSLGLAPTIVDRLLEIVRAIHDNGTTVILVEQSVNVALRLAKRAVFMEKGEIRFSGPTSELLGRTDILRSVFLQGAQSFSGTPSSNGNGKANGKKNGASPRTKDQQANALLDNPIVLETRGLTKRYGGVTAVNDVDLELHQGQILGLIGPNGAGKTSIFDLISGFTIPDRGYVELEGHEVTQWPAWRRATAGLARGFQDARLWPSLTVREALAAAVGSSVTSPLPAFLGLPASKDAEIALAARVEEVIELLGLGAFRDKFVSELSTGSRRIVEIASLLPNAPKVIILDEPSSGIAQKETEALGPLLKEVQRYLDCSILLIEHDMPLISSLADHLVGLELGEVIAFGRPSEVLNNPRVVESYLGNTTYSELSHN